MFNGLGTTEMMLLGVIALLLFGSRLPEIARRFGATYRDLRGKVDEFQREFRDWDKEDTSTSSRPTSYLSPPEDEPKKSEPTTPKFVPPPEDDDD
ncbi:MAG TPA: twin-arginine translocation protein, TatA/E family subunit [Planctomycetaceae bacterium]|nr:twin-arginine translocation protein, TatA/E family subunit [Planctomycetaceae bacterium]